jgi:branched-chain amino acid transport system substrate-binding protein
MAIAEEAEARGLVQVSNVSTAQDLNYDPASGHNREFVFRVCTSDGVMGGLLAAFARERLHARRAAVLYEVGRTYSARLARSFIDRFREAGGPRVTAEFVYLALETDFRAQLREVQAFAPDVVFLPGSFTDATLIARQAEQLGLRATLLGADAWSSPLLFKRGGPSRPAHFLDHCSPPARFNERYRAEFGQEVQGCRAALAYDAVQAIAAGLGSLGRLDLEDLGKRLSETRRRLRDAVAGVDFSGVTGRVRFDRAGDRPTGMAVMAVEPEASGGFVTRLEGWVGGR